MLDYLPPYSPELNPIERFGNSRVASASTTDTFLPWRKSSLPWKHSSDIGPTETRLCVVYAQLLKTLCLEVAL
jgi:transposase